MNKGLIAAQSIVINAPIEKIWDALVNPDLIKQYMFGTNVMSEWKEGSAITWKGEWQGKAYEDKGVILKLDKPHLLKYSHFSPLTGEPDLPENYHTVTIELSDQDGAVKVDLRQDNNATQEAKDHSEKNWGMMLADLKKLVEG
jgi:uncharacterized protein YndB with AHSA1/START domain